MKWASHKGTYIVWFHSDEVPRVVILTETESQMVVSRRKGEGGMQSYWFINMEFQFWKKKKFSRSRWWWWHRVNILNALELWTLKMVKIENVILHILYHKKKKINTQNAFSVMKFISKPSQLNRSDGSVTNWVLKQLYSRVHKRVGPHFPVQCVQLCELWEKQVLLRQTLLRRAPCLIYLL